MAAPAAPDVPAADHHHHHHRSTGSAHWRAWVARAQQALFPTRSTTAPEATSGLAPSPAAEAPTAPSAPSPSASGQHAFTGTLQAEQALQQTCAFGGSDPVEVDVSAVAYCNQRKQMEDYATVLPALRFPQAPAPYDAHDFGWFAVYDGHAGTACAAFMEANMLPVLREAFRTDCASTPEDALAAALAALSLEWDQVKCADENAAHVGAGTCVTLAWFDWTARKLVVLNLGDSKVCVWSTPAGAKLLETTDHDPASPEEEALVKTLHNAYTKLPGAVTTRFYTRPGGTSGGSSPTTMAIARVNGQLAVSRALGNNSRLLKGNVSRVPDISKLDLPEVDEFWCVLGSDGLWDGAPVAFVGAWAAGKAQQQQPSPSPQTTLSPACHLAQHSYTAGIRDNITCIAIHGASR